MMSLLTQITLKWTAFWTFRRAQMRMERCFDPALVLLRRMCARTNQTTLLFCVQMVTLYLVKWCSLPYEDSTWELKADIDQSKIEEYEHIAAHSPCTKRVVCVCVCV